MKSSLVPMPSPLPVFDHLQYINMEGRAWRLLKLTRNY